MIVAAAAFKHFGLSTTPLNVKGDTLFQYCLTSLMPLSQSSGTVSIDVGHFPAFDSKSRDDANDAIKHIFHSRDRLQEYAGAYARWVQIGHSVFQGVQVEVAEVQNGNGLWMLGAVHNSDEGKTIITTGIDCSRVTDGEFMFGALHFFFCVAMGVVVAPPWVMVPNRNPGAHPHSVVLPDYIVAELVDLDWLDGAMGMYTMAPTATIWPPVPGFDTDSDQILEDRDDHPFDVDAKIDKLFDDEYKLGLKKRPAPTDGEDPNDAKFQVKRRYIKDGILYQYDVGINDDEDTENLSRTLVEATVNVDPSANIAAIFDLFISLLRQRLP
eukprot:s999_g24.t1